MDLDRGGPYTCIFLYTCLFFLQVEDVLPAVTDLWAAGTGGDDLLHVRLQGGGGGGGGQQCHHHQAQGPGPQATADAHQGPLLGEPAHVPAGHPRAGGYLIWQLTAFHYWSVVGVVFTS